MAAGGELPRDERVQVLSWRSSAGVRFEDPSVDEERHGFDLEVADEAREAVHNQSIEQLRREGDGNGQHAVRVWTAHAEDGADPARRDEIARGDHWPTFGVESSLRVGDEEGPVGAPLQPARNDRAAITGRREVETQIGEKLDEHRRSLHESVEQGDAAVPLRAPAIAPRRVVPRRAEQREHRRLWEKGRIPTRCIRDECSVVWGKPTEWQHDEDPSQDDRRKRPN